MPRKSPVQAQSIPNSWLVRDWDTAAPHVVPNSKRRAQKFIKRYRRQLLACGALMRIGKNNAICGPGYAEFLRTYIGAKPYIVPANVARARTLAAAQAARAAAESAAASATTGAAEGASDAAAAP